MASGGTTPRPSHGSAERRGRATRSPSTTSAPCTRTAWGRAGLRCSARLVHPRGKARIRARTEQRRVDLPRRCGRRTRLREGPWLVREGRRTGQCRGPVPPRLDVRERVGCRPDVATALDWFNDAAEQGHPGAQASWASLSSMVAASSATTPRRSPGSARRPRGATPGRSTTWA